jgi:hypothetical protein
VKGLPAGAPLTWGGLLLVLRQDTMSSPQKHRDHRENPYLTAGDAPVAIPALRASVVTICAKRTQFRPAAGGGWKKLCKTKPNLRGLGYVGKGHRRVGVARSGSETCKTNPIWGPGAPRLRIEDCGLKGAGRGRVPEAKCAKRTQLGPGGSGVGPYVKL